MLTLLLALALALVPCEAYLVPSSAVRPAARAALRRRPAATTMMSDSDDEVTFTFGDAQVSEETAAAVAGEEAELSEKEKEIARLKAAEVFMRRDTGNARCTTCGFKYMMAEGSVGLPKGTPWELVGDSWACPQCKSPKAFFESETVEVAGFEDNQSYGFGTNTWTESQKSTAIFGGIAAFAALLLGGYALN